MAADYPLVQGEMPQDGSIIEFAGRKYFNKPSSLSGSSSASSSEGSGSESGSEERKARAARMANSKRRASSSSSSEDSSQKRRPGSRMKKNLDKNEIADAFAFLDCAKGGSSSDIDTSDAEEASQDMGEILSRGVPKVETIEAQPKSTKKRKRKRKMGQQPQDEEDGEETTVLEGSEALPAHRVVRGMGRDADWIDENDVEEDAAQRAGYFKPIVSPFRQMIEAMLRPDEDPNDPKCWGCDNQEDGDYAVVEKQWNTLMNMFEKRLHKMHPAHLGVFMYRFFAERTAVKMTQAGQMEVKAQLINKGKNEQGRVVYQFDYSVWSAYSMFRHFTRHHLNPKTQITMDLWELLYAKFQLLDDGLYRRHIHSGRVVVDKEAIQTCKLLNQQIYQLYRMKPEQMLFFNPNSAIDTQGYAYINSDRPIIHTHGGSDIFRMNYDTTN